MYRDPLVSAEKKLSAGDRSNSLPNLQCTLAHCMRAYGMLLCTLEREKTMNITTVTSKGQITLPKEVRKALGLKQGDQVLFILEGDRVVLTPLLKGYPLSRLYAALPATRPYPGHEAIRQELHSALGERIARGDE